MMSSDIISHSTTKHIDELIEKLKTDKELTGGDRLDITMNLELVQFYHKELKNVLDRGDMHGTV